MPYVIATERATYWAAGEPVVASGLTEVGGCTVTGLPMVSAADENEFLAQTVALAGDYNPLPDDGWLEAGEIYGYAGGLVIVRQSHTRTEHAPEDVPALFSVYREGAADTLDWVANERVEVGFRRLYGDVLYECIQAHTTQTDWTPPAVPALWKLVQEEPGPGLQEWVSGEQLVYDPANPIIRTYQGRKYQLRQNPGINIWPPPTVPALWLDIGPIE
jgi:hypothetical protein